MQISYKALARIWRPRTFDEIVGQEDTTLSLKNALNTGRVHHAWLFSGTRGVGKTTVARILAKALNCTGDGESKPCLQCENCMSFQDGNFIDVIEIDAASRTKVEDTRELLENVQYLPAKGRFKVYIIDEVHMLSTHSFNALLKTLEEPPEHVKFILATTNPDKLPITVLSRCLRFHLRNLLPAEIAKQMGVILDKEQIAYETSCLMTLANLARGSMRDGLSMLDGAIALADGKVDQTVIGKMIGMVDLGKLNQLLSALFKRNRTKTLELCQAIAEQGVDFSHLTDEMLSIFHKLSVYKLTNHYVADGSLDEESFCQLSQQVSLEDLQFFYQVALKSKGEFALASHAFVVFEMMLIRMLVFSLGVDEALGTAAVDSTNDTVEKELKSSEPMVNEPMLIDRAEVLPVEELSETVREEAVKPASKVPPPVSKVVTMPAAKLPSVEAWANVVESLGLTGLAQTVLIQSEFVSFNEDGLLVLLLEEGNRSIANEIVLDRITSSLERHFSKKVRLEINFSNEPLKSPFREKKRLERERHESTKEELLSDGALKQVVEQCQGEILTETIKHEESGL